MRGMSFLRMIYLALAVLGAGLSLPGIAGFWRVDAVNLQGLAAGWTEFAGGSGHLWDLAIGTIALSIWVVAETRVRGNWTALFSIPATLVFGIGCGLPLYLWLRTRAVD